MIDNNLESILKEFGYNIKYSYDDDKCSQACFRELGKSRYNKFWKKVIGHNSLPPHELEQLIMNDLKNDVKALKILFSGQIAISYEMFKIMYKHISDSINENKVYKILELGGFDGWASCFLKRNLEVETEVTMIDINPLKLKNNEEIQIVNSYYDDYKSADKFDIIFSILGSTIDTIDSLISCCVDNSMASSKIFLGLRLQSYEDKIFINKFRDLGFESLDPNPIRIQVKLDTGSQTFPIYGFTKVQ